MHIGREGFVEQPRCCRRVAGLEMAEREVPAQVAEERAVARIGGKPGRQKGASGIGVTLLIAQMPESMCRPGVLRVLGEGALDFRAGGVALSVFRKRHAVVRREPPIVPIARGQPFEQFQQHALLPGAAGTADQAVGERRGAERHGIAGPGVKVRKQRGQRGLGIARHEQTEEDDMAGFPRRQSRDERLGRRHRGARRRRVAALQQNVRLCGMCQGKVGSAAMARSNAWSAPGYIVSFAWHPST